MSEECSACACACAVLKFKSGSLQVLFLRILESSPLKAHVGILSFFLVLSPNQFAH